MEIKGEITDIIYQNDVNSYTIAVFETEEEETTIVGYLPFVKSGDTLRVEGKFVEHKDYGRQFKVETFEKLMPETLDALEKYLANGSVKGIGEATAKKIIKTFGEDTINVFKFEPEKLAQIKGISKNKAIEMSESFLENWEVWQIVGFLERFGIGAENAKKIYDLLGINAIEQIEVNPYILIDMARGVDFKQIDQMALKLGIDYDNQKRVESGIKYSLIKATYNGHSCVIKENLIEYVISLLDVTTEAVEENIINLKAKEEIVVEKRDDFEWIYLENFYSVEKEIATRIIRLDKSKNVKKIEHIENALKDIEKKSSIELSDKQREAVLSINDSNVTIITGGPGTGKTTIIKTIIDLFEERKKKVVLTAPTGRAAKKMTEATGKEASTLHRLLGIGKLDDEGIYSRHSDYKGEPIDADLIVVDELSMVDMFVMNYLLNCIYQGTKLILVGDVDQLASVGPGSVLKDLINSEVINTVKLDKIFRQAAKSKIVLNAHRVNNGLGFIKNDDEEIEEDTKQDFFFIKQNSTERMLQEVISLSTGRLEKFGNYDFFKNIQVLTPTKKGPLGTRELNKALQAVLNPNLEELPERKSGDIVYRVGDRVMQIKNNYDLQFKRDNGEYGTGVFNGDVGFITDIDPRGGILKVRYDDRIVTYFNEELGQLELAYAVTVHKSQGSEYDCVVIPLFEVPSRLKYRNLLYTAVTRAKRLLVIVGDEGIWYEMAANDKKTLRYTMLGRFLKEYGNESTY